MRRRLALLERATRTTPQDHVVTLVSPVVYALVAITFVGLFALGIVLAEHLYLFFRAEWLLQPSIFVFDNDGYALFLFLLIIPLILFVATLLQGLLMCIPIVANSMTAANAMQFPSRGHALFAQQRASLKEMREAVRYLDLRFLQWHTLKRLAMSFVIVSIFSHRFYGTQPIPMLSSLFRGGWECDLRQISMSAR